MFPLRLPFAEAPIETPAFGKTAVWRSVSRWFWERKVNGGSSLTEVIQSLAHVQTPGNQTNYFSRRSFFLFVDGSAATALCLAHPMVVFLNQPVQLAPSQP